MDTQSLDQVFNTARRRVLNGEQLTIGEQQELIRTLRANRFSAGETSTTSKTKKVAAKQAKVGMTDDQLLSDLDSLGL